MASKRAAFVVAASVLFLNSSGSAQGLKTADLQKVYGSRWVPLTVPDSRIGPGAIISIKKGEVAWESSLDKCGAPKNVMAPVPSNASGIDAKTEGEYGADVALKIGGVSIGPNFKRAKRASLKLVSSRAEGIDRITLGEWFNAQGTTLSATCKKFLTQKDVFLVQEAYRVDKGRLTFYDDKNAKLTLSGLNAGIVNVGASAKAAHVVDDSLEFDMPMYTAIRRLKYLKNGDLQTLSAPGAETTRDDELRKLLKAQQVK